MAIERNRIIWFGTIFPYMVIEGNEGIPFSAKIYTLDVAVLFELILYLLVLILTQLYYLYERLCIHIKSSTCIQNIPHYKKILKKWCSSLHKFTVIMNISQYCVLIIYIYTVKAIVFSIATIQPTGWVADLHSHMFYSFICTRETLSCSTSGIGQLPGQLCIDL